VFTNRERRTYRRTFSILATVGLLAAMVTAGSGVATAGGRNVTLQVRPVVVGWDDTGCGEWGVNLDLYSLQGDKVGFAHPCADVVTDVNRAGTWRVLVVGHVELQLQGGTASGPVQWDRQVWVPDAANPEVIERFTASLTGAGAYAGQEGSISGGGIVQYDGEDPVDFTLWTITLRQG
jgi:hypothetical protein